MLLIAVFGCIFAKLIINNMTLSMTGFGRAEGICVSKRISVYVKSLNSKNLDLNTKIPLRYKEKEFEIRKLLSDKIFRGKVDFYINIENMDGETDTILNKEVIKNYMSELSQIANSAISVDLLKIAIRLPDSLLASDTELSEEEWNSLKYIINQAISDLVDFRITEGRSLEKEIYNYIKNIEKNLSNVENFEGVRIKSIKDRILNNLKEFGNIDENRFYQELVFYVEKLDISEEKTRLSQHCKYFLEVLNKEEKNGKKLGFIAQEIGREINTLGSKANNQDIQKLVVEMKDDLEKIKEQTLNIL